MGMITDKHVLENSIYFFLAAASSSFCNSDETFSLSKTKDWARRDKPWQHEPYVHPHIWRWHALYEESGMPQIDVPHP